MKYLMMCLVGLFMCGCATTQLEKRVQNLEIVATGQQHIIDIHKQVILKLIETVKDKLNMSL